MNNIDYTGDAHSALLWLVIGIVILIVHFIPSYLAYSNNHPSKGLILVLNILMGWTGLGWIILLIWASKK